MSAAAARKVGKTCTDCDTWFPMSAFARKGPHRREGRCKRCKSARRGEDYRMGQARALNRIVRETGIEPYRGRACSKCGHWKPKSAFPAKRGLQGARSAQCWACEKSPAEDPMRVRSATHRILASAGMKRCPDCATARPLGEFHRSVRLSSGRATYCRSCQRRRNARTLYGVDRDALGTSCAVCGDEIVGVVGHVDHDHVDGVARGIVHPACNQLVGYAERHRKKVEAAIRYADAHAERRGEQRLFA